MGRGGSAQLSDTTANKLAHERENLFTLGAAIKIDSVQHPLILLVVQRIFSITTSFWRKLSSLPEFMGILPNFDVY